MKKSVVLLVVMFVMINVVTNTYAQRSLNVGVSGFFVKKAKGLVHDAEGYPVYTIDELKFGIIFASKSKLDSTLAVSVCKGETSIKGIKKYTKTGTWLKLETKKYPYLYVMIWDGKSPDGHQVYILKEYSTDNILEITVYKIYISSNEEESDI